MRYANSYFTSAQIADRIRQGAQEGKKVKPGLGLASRERTQTRSMDLPDFDEIRAEYMNLVQDMFASQTPAAPTEEDFVDIEEYLDTVGSAPAPDAGKPRRNPKNFVSDVNTGKLSERDLLALTLQAEAGGEGELGMLAVGSVIANRVNADGYGNSFRDVILSPAQFSAWNSVTGYLGGKGGLDMASMRAGETAYAVADKILSGDYESPVGSATHYYNPKDADPDWGKRGGGQWTPIGNHVFGYGN